MLPSIASNAGVFFHPQLEEGLSLPLTVGLTLCICPDSEPAKLPYQPEQKTRRGGGLRQINTCLKFPLQVKFLDNDIWH